MKYGINLNSITPVRSEPAEQSEMVSQLLFGDTFISGEPEENNFYKIRNYADNYTGWVQKKMITTIPEKTYHELNTQETYKVVVPLAEAFDLDSKSIIRIPGGSKLPFCDDIGRFGLENKKFQIHRDFLLPANELQTDGLENTALSFLNTPYLWGGKNVLGMDCSGFTQVVFSMHGIQLMRDAKEQATQGEAVPFSGLRNHDLLFFSNEQGAITHVGIYLGNQKIVHCSGRVRIDRVDDTGIFSEEEKNYSHTFCTARRL